MAVSLNVGDYSGTAASLGVTSTIIKPDIVDAPFYEEPSAAPLIMLLKRGRRVKATSYKHEWHEQQRLPTVDQVNNSGGYTAGATSVVVDNGVYVAVNDLIRIQRTGEVLHVTARSTNTLTVSRSWGGTAAAALNDNDHYTILGGAAAEGASAELGRSVKEVAKYNVTQILRDPYGLTGTQNAVDTYGKDKLERMRFDRGQDHKVKMELSAFFGERAEDTSGDEPRRSAGGLHEFISTNSTDFGGVVTWEEIVQSAQDDFRYGKKKKFLFLARAAASSVSNIAKDHLEVSVPVETFGIKMSRVTTQHGDYIMITEDLFEGDEYAKMGFVVDMDNFAYVYLQTRDTMLKREILANVSDDAVKEEWLTEFTFQRILERTHSIWDNVA